MTSSVMIDEPLKQSEVGYAPAFGASKVTIEDSTVVSCCEPSDVPTNHVDEQQPEETKSGSGPIILATKNKKKGPSHHSIARTGRWTPDEKILFLYGLRLFGKGRWKKMSCYLPHRSLVQIKSHGQKVLKRQEAGENIFHRLEENYHKIDHLVVDAARQRDTLNAVSDNSLPNNNYNKSTPKNNNNKEKKQKQNQSNSSTGNKPHMINEHVKQLSEGSVLAAAALCQLRVTR